MHALIIATAIASLFIFIVNQLNPEKWLKAYIPFVLRQGTSTNCDILSKVQVCSSWHYTKTYTYQQEKDISTHLIACMQSVVMMCSSFASEGLQGFWFRYHGFCFVLWVFIIFSWSVWFLIILSWVFMVLVGFYCFFHWFVVCFSWCFMMFHGFSNQFLYVSRCFWDKKKLHTPCSPGGFMVVSNRGFDWRLCKISFTQNNHSSSSSGNF